MIATCQSCKRSEDECLAERRSLGGVDHCSYWMSPYVFNGVPWLDGKVYFGCDDSGVVIHPPRSTIVATEDGDTAFVPKRWYTRSQAKMQGIHGECPVADLYIDVRCRTVWLRREDRYEDGVRLDSWVDAGAMYYGCSKDDEHAEAYWELTCARAAGCVKPTKEGDSS